MKIFKLNAIKATALQTGNKRPKVQINHRKLHTETER